MGIGSLLGLNYRLVVLALVAAVTLAATFHTASAAPPEEIGPEFTLFHKESGGIPVFGYALSPRVIEHGRVTQYLERQRFELHPENKRPYTVLLGHLGAEEARERGLRGTAAFAPLSAGEGRDPECRYFEQTGFEVCSHFKDYWESHGLNMGDRDVSDRESLALFGYPISRAFTDPDTGLKTQYFERARFEYHEEHAGTQYEVLLGRVGSPLWKARHQFAELAPESETGVASGDFIWPAEGDVTQEYGHSGFAMGGAYGGGGHTGLDIANSTGTPIHAADGGTVTESGWMNGYGYTVVIDHGNGYETLYAHLAAQPPVSAGQSVSQGEFIGLMGSTGFSTGPHLHFEILKDGDPLDPLAYLR